MGLFDFLRRLFSKQPSDRNAAPVVLPVADPESNEAAKCGLTPLRYRSSLKPVPPADEQADRSPYLFSWRNPQNDGFLDLSTDADEQWLADFGLPHLKTPTDLADFLQVPPGQLAWLIHRGQPGCRPGSVRKAHYHYRWLPRKTGGHRLIEAPRPRLKAVQRRILRGILNRVPAHPAAHGFVSGRSIRTNAEPHVGRSILLTFDLENFYPSVGYSRVVAIFRTMGFSREVALWLARLTTSTVPPGLTAPSEADLRPYRTRHLPQGAPTSPALANLSAFALDVRLSGLARRFDVRYTRYADDITFSGHGRFGGALKDFIPLVTAIVRDERFSVHRRKRRVLRRGQRQMVTGVVVNEKINAARRDYDQLRAILHNCIRHGPSTQNRDGLEHFAAHLAGRIGHIRHLNPQRGHRLRQMFDRIDWSR